VCFQSSNSELSHLVASSRFSYSIPNQQMLNIFSHKAPAKTLTRLRGTFSSYEEKSFARKSLTCFLNISKDSTPLFSLPGKGFTVSRVSPFRNPESCVRSALCALERVGITFRGKRRNILRNSFKGDIGCVRAGREKRAAAPFPRRARTRGGLSRLEFPLFVESSSSRRLDRST